MAENLSLILGPWTFVFAPDGDDPGVGTVTVESSFGRRAYFLMESDVDGVTREEWDMFVRGATL